MIKHQMFIALALLSGVAIGYFVKNEPVAAEKSAKAEERAKKPVADRGEEASVKALRARIAELEGQLAEREETVAISNVVAEAAQARPPESPRQSWRERMDEMKKNAPERYAEMTNRFARWRRDQSERARNKIDFLSSIDTTQMSAEAKKTHAALQNLIARREELSALLHQEDLSDEERGQVMRKLGESHHEMMRLNAEERRNLFAETARNLGFEGEEANEFSATIQAVIEATDGGWGGGHHGGGRHGGGPRGAGGPGGR